MAPLNLNMTLTLNPMRAAQIALGGAALFGGYKLGSDIIRTAYRDDLLGDPTRIVEVDDRTVIYQMREPQGGRLTNIMLGAGAASAFAGGALVLGTPAGTTGIKAIARSAGGIGLFALGLGAIAGASAMAAQFSGADFRPVR